jgi:hypothetical protein
MKIKTADLIGRPLDWAVATCEGEVTELFSDGIIWSFKLNGHLKVMANAIHGRWAQSMVYLPSTDWAQGGSIIEQERITVGWAYPPCAHESVRAVAQYFEPTHTALTIYRQFGPTPLIAAMRCYVASKLGDEVDVPEELC